MAGTPDRARESGQRNKGVDQDVEGQGGEGKLHERETPDIAEDANKGETQRDAPADDVGVPADEEMNNPG
jgi:hypothetical protein